MEASTKRYFRTPEAAAYLGISTSTLEKLRVFGGGPPYYKLGAGRVVVYLVQDLDAWAQARPHASTSEDGALPQPAERRRRAKRQAPEW